MFRLRAPDDTTLRALLDRSAVSSFTYQEIGATRGETLPHGYTHDRYRAVLGRGTFERAADGLRTWQAHVRRRAQR